MRGGSVRRSQSPVGRRARVRECQNGWRQVCDSKLWTLNRGLKCGSAAHPGDAVAGCGAAVRGSEGHGHTGQEKEDLWKETLVKEGKTSLVQAWIEAGRWPALLYHSRHRPADLLESGLALL